MSFCEFRMICAGENADIANSIGTESSGAIFIM